MIAANPPTLIRICWPIGPCNFLNYYFKMLEPEQSFRRNVLSLTVLRIFMALEGGVTQETLF